MQLKDYLHLYPGVKIDFIDDAGDWQTGKLIETGWHSKFPVTINYMGYKYYRDYQDLRLHLRPLESMTEAEEKYMDDELWDYMFPSHAKKHGYTTEQFLWLLKNHFDIFGLIQAGLAIYEKKAA